MPRIPYKQWLRIIKKVPLVAADALVIKNRKILLIERTIHPYKGCKALPGGMVDHGETVEQAAVREVYEETGLKTKVVRLAGVYSDPKRDPRGHLISIAFIMKPAGGKLRGSSETRNVRFYDLNNLPKLAFDHDKMIKDALKMFRDSEGC